MTAAVVRLRHIKVGVRVAFRIIFSMYLYRMWEDKTTHSKPLQDYCYAYCDSNCRTSYPAYVLDNVSCLRQNLGLSVLVGEHQWAFVPPTILGVVSVRVCVYLQCFFAEKGHKN